MAAADRVGRVLRHIRPEMSSEEDAVLLQVQHGIAIVTLNRPDNRNSMTAELLASFRDKISCIKADPDVRCVVITGRGNCFSSGADFKSRDQLQGALSSWERSLKNMYGPFLSTLDLSVPVIGALNGHAIGGGLGLALVCDIRVANRESKYGANFAKLGLHPGMATTYILPRLVGMPKAMELVFTGDLVSGEAAAQLGLANYATAPDQVLHKALEIARKISANAPLAVKWSKISLLQHMSFDPRPAAMLEAHMQSRSFETNDTKEGVQALLEKRAPVFKGE